MSVGETVVSNLFVNTSRFSMITYKGDVNTAEIAVATYSNKGMQCLTLARYIANCIKVKQSQGVIQRNETKNTEQNNE